MLNPQVAQARLKEFETADSHGKQIARVRKLPPASRVAALALLGLKGDETPFITADYSDYAKRNKQRDAEEKAREAAYAVLDGASEAERETVFAAFFPRLGGLLARWWMPEGAVLYQGGYNRRPFRWASNGGSAYEVRRGRQTMLHQLIGSLRSYQEMPIDWLAIWSAYLGPYNADLFGRLFASVIDDGGPDGDAIFEILMASARGDHEIGAMGRHVTRGLLSASRPDGWELMEKTLLAAQRQEGLRQSILEVADEAHPTAFRRMLKLIRENDLYRFSATIRAADVWFGMNWVAYEKLSVKQANAATETVETFLSDPQGRDEILATATDGQVVYLALWSVAFDDARAAMQAAVALLADPILTRRYAALHLLVELRLEEAKPAILAAFDDADLRMAQKAFAHSNWYENKARAGSYEAIAADLDERHSELTSVLETEAEPGTPIAGWLGSLKEAMATMAAVIKKHGADAASDKVAETAALVAANIGDDRFDRLIRNLPRFPAQGKVLEPVIWEWDKLTAHAEALADALPRVIGARPLDDLFPYISQMSSYGRAQVADAIGKNANKTAAMRTVLFDLTADTASQVRANAFKAFEKDGWQLEADETVKIEALLTRKAADLRKSALSLLLRQDDDAVIESAARLTRAKDANQRLAGLDVLTQMVEKKRALDKARAVVAQFTTARADKLTDAEKGMLAPLTDETHEKPTLDNALGLMDDNKRTWATRPVERNRFAYATMSAEAIIGGLNGFIEQYKELPIKIGDGDDNTETMLGNLTNSWRFPSPDYKLTLEEDRERCPVLDQLVAWWEGRPSKARDDDGFELLRTDLAITANTENTWGEKMDTKAWAIVDPLYSPIPMYVGLVPQLLGWLRRLYPAQGDIADFYLDGADAVLARVGADYEAKPVYRFWGANARGLAYLFAARSHYNKNADAWTSEQITRLWNALRWVDQPNREIKGRNRIAKIEDVAAAFRIGAATDHDVYDQLLVRGDGGYGSFNDLRDLSGRKAVPLTEKTPALRPIVEACRKRVLEVELTRGDTATAASAPARALRYSGGMDTLLKLVAALGKDSFARGYSYYGETNRSNVFSHLIRVTFPGDGETPEAFAKAAKAAKISEKRLIETAMYAPQWARHVEKALGWDGSTQAVWWLHAHTKDNSWSVEAEIKEAWTTEIADKTPLSAEDLTEGAVDVAWFGRVHEALGEERWGQVDEAAKFASSAGGHKRAQLFAEAMLNQLDRADLLARIKDKRHQDSLRALGLMPLPPKNKPAFETDLLARYKTMQEFVRTSKQFGAQRQESEKLAARIGMENLARTAGYADPNRLTWAMEAASVADLKNGPVTETVGEVSVSLAINGLGLPELTIVKKGKSLANIPPAVKKEPEIAALVARKTDLTRQVSRMRESLEAAMCRGDRFTGAELETLLEHPILRPLLQNLIFIEEDSKEAILGYPLGGNRVEDYNGVDFGVSAKATFRIAHPFDLLQSGRWEQWQKDCFLRERIQPFKQVFRELYVPTDSETADGTKSERYAGHQVNPKQALALFSKRGWVGGGEYDYDGEGPRKTFHTDGYTVSVAFMGYSATPADVEGSTVNEVRFTKKNEWKPVALKSVPPRVFSEAMRDLDLVVSVAHVGGVDPEASQSTVEMREALVREAMDLLKIKNVRFQKSHAVVDGALATYNVHLGSAIVHRQPGGYLCIVPVHSQHRGRLFLPFVDDDPRSAEVVSKVLLLARDNEIKDPTILEQILQVR